MSGDNFSDIRVALLSGEEFQRFQRLDEIVGAAVDEATKDFNYDIVRGEEMNTGERR